MVLTKMKEIAEAYQLVYEKKKLDPVGKEDDDVDNDGDVDSSDEYLKKRRAAIGKAMGIKKSILKTVGPKYSSSLNENPIGSFILISPEKINRDPTKNLKKCTIYLIILQVN